MNFNENNIPICDAQTMPQETLSELMGVAKNMGEDALEKVERISNHLFGKGLNGIEKGEAKCYKDALLQHCKILDNLNYELNNLANLLGCVR